MESLSVGGQILLSKEALEHTVSPIDVSGKRDIQAKGLRRPMTIYEVRGIGGETIKNSCGETEDCFVPVKDWVMFNMYPVQGKMVQETAVTGRLTAISSKRAVVLLEEDSDDETGSFMDIGADVEIFAAAQTGKALMTEIYAKMIQREDREITLRFTHVNKSFERFWEKISEVRNGK
jgi:hypothetical protein